MVLDSLKRFVTDHVFNSAGIVGCRFTRNTQLDQQLAEDGVAVQNVFRQSPAFFRQMDKTVFFHGNKAVVFQQTYSTGYAGLGLAHVFADVYGTDLLFFTRKDQNGFQIHFTGFLQCHTISPFCVFFLAYHEREKFASIAPEK